MTRKAFGIFVLLVLCTFSSPLFAQDKKPVQAQNAVPFADFLAGAAAGSSGYERDVAVFHGTRKLKGSDLWTRAISNAKDTANPQRLFLDSFGLEIDSTATPATLELLEMVSSHLGDMPGSAREDYRQARPFVYFSARGESCVPEDESSLAEERSYSSSPAARDWGLALVLAEISPERQGRILRRGYERGLLRVICGTDWQSDVESAQNAAGDIIDQLHNDKKFQRAFSRAKREIALLRKSETKHARASKASDSQKLAPGFVYVSEFVPDALLDIRYYSSYNFVGVRVDGYRAPVAILARPAARALVRAAYLARECGYILRIFDGYRPQASVDHFVRWAKDQDDKSTKDIFYPDVDKSGLFAKGYIMEKSGHTRGSTVDLTLVDIMTGKEIDMGSPFDFFGPVSHHGATGVSSEQAQNRKILKSIMQMAGFIPYEKEWWHYTLMNEPYPDVYFNFFVD